MPLKGLGYADKTIADKDVPGNIINGVARIGSLDLDCWYNWNQTRFEGTVFQADPFFIPMLYSDSPTRLVNLESDLDGLNMPKHILGFNEPDLIGQAQMTVDEAIAAWPALEEAAAKEGLKIGAPATISPNNAWFQEFMEKAMALGLKIDFIPVHIYQNPHVGTFLSKIDALYAAYGLPVWVTETAVADFTAEKGIGTAKSMRYTRSQVNAYMKALWVELQTRPWLERFCWKTRNVNDNQMWFSALFNDDGSLTGTGQAYRDLT